VTLAGLIVGIGRNAQISEDIRFPYTHTYMHAHSHIITYSYIFVLCVLCCSFHGLLSYLFVFCVVVVFLVVVYYAHTLYINIFIYYDCLCNMYLCISSTLTQLRIFALT